jgi:hypothetical protein
MSVVQSTRLAQSITQSTSLVMSMSHSPRVKVQPMNEQSSYIRDRSFSGPITNTPLLERVGVAPVPLLWLLYCFVKKPEKACLEYVSYNEVFQDNSKSHCSQSWSP